MASIEKEQVLNLLRREISGCFDRYTFDILRRLYAAVYTLHEAEDAKKTSDDTPRGFVEIPACAASSGKPTYVRADRIVSYRDYFVVTANERAPIETSATAEQITTLIKEARE